MRMLDHMDMNETDDVISTERRSRDMMCVGCGEAILDQYVLRVAPDLEWHADCLKCVQCGQQLNELCTCFVRDGKTYCKSDYARLFGMKCAGCEIVFDNNDLVMRARDRVYHVDCFRCLLCARRLLPGDEFALRDDTLYCSDDYHHTASCTPLQEINNGTTSSSAALASNLGSSSEMGVNPSGGVTGKDVLEFGRDVDIAFYNNNNDFVKHKSRDIDNSPRNSAESSGGGGSSSIRLGASGSRKKVGPGGGGESLGHGRGGSKSGHKPSDHKTTRVRTVLNEKQLHTLRTCYGANPRPDALMKDQLVEMTGLSSRVIRVWFQNKRCKDKKRTILIKQIQQQHQDKLHGVAMVASSPVHLHDASSNILQSHSVEVHQYFQQHTTSSTGGGLPSWNEYSPLANSLSSADQAPFQQLLDTFGHDSTADDDDDDDDDDEDDTVVNIVESSSASLTRGHSSSHRSGGVTREPGSMGMSRNSSRHLYPCVTSSRRSMNHGLRVNNAAPFLCSDG